MSHLKTLHAQIVVDGRQNLALSIADFARLSPNEQSVLTSAFMKQYPMEGSTEEEPILMPFCKRGCTIPQLQAELDNTKSRIGNIARKVLKDQDYFGKSYKQIYGKRK